MTSLHRPSPSRKSPKLTAHGGPKALAAPATSAIKDVYRQDQPHGEDGIRFSLKRVCMMIAEGRLHPDVRAWTTKKLAAVGNPKGAKARAKALLEAVRAQSGWVPDPIDAEFMAGAHLTLGDGDKPPYFALGDCDDLTIALGSAILAPLMYLTAAGSVGTRAAVVGHAYGTDRNIEHVLGAIFDPNDNKWYYVDPSLKDMPFGECRPFTRERVYLVPSAELLCDDRVCLAPGGRSSGPPPMPRRGDFVAVNGAPGMDLVEPPSWVDGVPNIDGRPDENETLVSQTDLTGILEATVTFAPPETAAQIENEALFQLWQDLEPCGAENPLHWCDINPPASTDYAAQELFQPWHDGIEPYSGASWLIPDSGFLPK